MPNATRYTQEPDDLPKGSRPEEFLADEHLASFYQRLADELPADSAKGRAARARAAKARLAAVTTEAVQAQAAVDSEAAFAQTQQDEKDRTDLFAKLVAGKKLTAEERERAAALADA